MSTTATNVKEVKTPQNIDKTPVNVVQPIKTYSTAEQRRNAPLHGNTKGFSLLG